MKKEQNNLPIWLITNAWREILTRIFEDEKVELNVSPDWLINPATNRKLKLDMLYPEIGVAVRFEGLQGKQRRRRLSLEEEAQMQVRHDARLDVSRAHGIQLIMIQVATDEPWAVFQQIDTTLNRAGQQATNQAHSEKLKRLRFKAAALARKIHALNDLKLYADLWQDRQYQAPEPTPVSPGRPIPSYTAGMAVEHTSFGSGVVIKTVPSDGDMVVTVDFVTAGLKTLMASLVADKLLPR
jgi:hypothetical protein